MSFKIPHDYEPRPYQIKFLQALDRGVKRLLIVWHRRSGKEKTCLNAVIKAMTQRVGGYYYMFPQLKQGRMILWDGMDKDGKRFLDHFPKELLDGEPNSSEMKVKFKNGSLFQILGSDYYNTNVGSNPVMMVYPEYSLCNPAAWGYYRPILAENGGTAIFNFTPRGENHAYDLYELAKNDPDHWFCELLTVDDTGCIPRDVLDQERNEIIRLYGNDALYQQEYYCNFTVPIAGAYYAEQVMRAYRDGRVGSVPADPRLAVDTWWDLGGAGGGDSMVIWFTQTVGSQIRLIDYHEDTGFGLPHYAKVLQDKGYVYGRHTAPHDIEVHDLGTGKSRKDTARQLGIDFFVCPKLGLADGIDAARAVLDRCYFDATKCHDGLNALKNYHKHYDEKRKVYVNEPYHDWSSHGADAFRYLAIGMDVRHQTKPSAPKDKYLRQSERRMPEHATVI